MASLKDLKPLRHQLTVHVDQAGEVVFRPVELAGSSDLARITDAGEYDRDIRCVLLDGNGSWGKSGEDDVRFHADEFFGVAGQARRVSIRSASDNANVSAVLPTEFR